MVATPNIQTPSNSFHQQDDRLLLMFRQLKDLFGRHHSCQHESLLPQWLYHTFLCPNICPIDLLIEWQLIPGVSLGKAYSWLICKIACLLSLFAFHIQRKFVYLFMMWYALSPGFLHQMFATNLQCLSGLAFMTSDKSFNLNSLTLKCE